MADVRSLLRNELSARRETESGRNSAAQSSKKRKLGSDHEDIRKKARATESVSTQGDEHENYDDDGMQANTQAEDPSAGEDAIDTLPQPSTSAQPQPQPQNIDDEEWAAFEREVAAPTRVPAPAATGALAADATISAAPLSAAELEARERENRTSQTTALETEAMGVHEDAARDMEEEFDQMEQLEERVRRLKEKRDEIRRHKENNANLESGPTAMQTDEAAEASQEESGEESEEEDEFDSWRFRRR